MLDASKIRMIVCDFDRTLTDADLTPSVEAFAAISDAKDLGLRFIVISGRQLDFLLSLEDINRLADAVVAENGAIAYELSTRKKSSPYLKEAKIIKQAFQESGLRFLQFDVMTSLSIRNLNAVKELIAKNKLDAEIHLNVDSIMVLPLGVTKASGLSLALDLMGAPKDGIIGFGDGENDLPLFEASDIAIAVANALPEVKAKADIVTTLTGGRGVAEQIRKMLPTFGRI